MKKYILLTLFLLCFFAGITANATGYIVEIDRDIFQTGISDSESFKVINAPDSYLYMTDDLDGIKWLEEMGMVIYYEEDIPVTFTDDFLISAPSEASVISDVYTPVYTDSDIPITLKALHNQEFYENYASYASFTNNLIARDMQKGDYTVRVGIIDSGIAIYDANGKLRDDFTNVVAGKSFVDSEPFKDTTNHGTPAAGLIGGKFSGVAPDCEMVSLKAFSGNSGSLGDVANAIYAGVNDYGCKVLNISASASSFNTAIKDAVNYALENNVIIVAAVGNEGNITSAVTYPANFPEVIGVGAVNSDGTHSYFSRVNSSVDVCAIGYNVYTTVSNNTTASNYEYTSGTSFSAPQVAGLAALLCSYDYDMTPDEFLEVLEATAFDPGESGYDKTFGHGIIDVKEALDFVTKKPQVYSSRMFLNGNKVNCKVYNNTTSKRTVSVINSYYDSLGKVIGYEPADVTLNPKTATAFSREVTWDSSKGEYFRLMVWQSVENMMPLYKARDYVK